METKITNIKELDVDKVELPRKIKEARHLCRALFKHPVFQVQ